MGSTGSGERFWVTQIMSRMRSFLGSGNKMSSLLSEKLSNTRLLKKFQHKVICMCNFKITKGGWVNVSGEYDEPLAYSANFHTGWQVRGLGGLGQG